MAEEHFEDVQASTSIWLPEKQGESIEGSITEFREGIFGIQAVLLSEKGEILTPSHKQLQSRLSECKIGEFIKITYERMELPKVAGRNPTRIYRVQRRVLTS